MSNLELARELYAIERHICEHQRQYKKRTGERWPEYERQIGVLHDARQVLRDYIDPCDIPF